MMREIHSVSNNLPQTHMKALYCVGGIDHFAYFQGVGEGGDSGSDWNQPGRSEENIRIENKRKCLNSARVII
ncbi:MAG: hypothetical protein ACP5VS_09065 [Desulfomonilaceae bacterium]